MIGGGIVGCGIARDAALRGLRVALFERADFGSGTTSASRASCTAGFATSRCWISASCGSICASAKRCCRDQPPTWSSRWSSSIPFFTGAPVWPLRLRLGLMLYDALSFDRSLPAPPC